jgi:hypothetical protein
MWIFGKYVYGLRCGQMTDCSSRIRSHRIHEDGEISGHFSTYSYRSFKDFPYTAEVSCLII